VVEFRLKIEITVSGRGWNVKCSCYIGRSRVTTVLGSGIRSDTLWAYPVYNQCRWCQGCVWGGVVCASDPGATGGGELGGGGVCTVRDVV